MDTPKNLIARPIDTDEAEQKILFVSDNPPPLIWFHPNMPPKNIFSSFDIFTRNEILNDSLSQKHELQIHITIHD